METGCLFTTFFLVPFVSWAFDTAYFLDEPTVFPPQFEETADAGGSVGTIVGNIRDNHRDIGSIDERGQQAEADLHDTQLRVLKTRERSRGVLRSKYECRMKIRTPGVQPSDVVTNRHKRNREIALCNYNARKTMPPPDMIGQFCLGRGYHGRWVASCDNRQGEPSSLKTHG
ncbi:hypothetical protein F5146DRAFT_1002220 [Armillaria mellea]|nr:hypothetical protein F5146DRAFT_1002220 [Armillaria mellea]